ncbi:hypothetical protein DIE21_08795 [Burkholderia sp. Bp9140]|nr:hypothetical protein DIE21_08795 [Burkholderia sp. Bp9140]
MEGQYRTRTAMNSATGGGVCASAASRPIARQRLRRWRLVPGAGTTRSPIGAGQQIAGSAAP